MTKRKNDETPRKTWRRPRLLEHGDLVDLTRQSKGGSGTDSGLGGVS